MPKSTTFSNDILALILNGTAIADLAENDATSPLATLYLRLHTADPGVGGSQLTNEIGYDNYAAEGVARTTGGFTAPSGGSSTNVALEQFPQCGASGATATHVSLGTEPTGAGKVLYAGALNSPLAISNLVRPQFAPGDLTVTES